MFLDGQDAGYRRNPNRNQFYAYGSTNRDNPGAYYDYFDLIIQSQSDQNPNDFYVVFGNNDGVLEEGRPRPTDCIIPGKSCSASAGFTASFNEKVTHSVVTGSSRLVPISAQQVGDALMFDNAQSGFWFATPSNLSGNSFELEMAGDAKFNAVSNFLAGLNDSSLFSISVGDSIVGQYKSGDNIDFVKLLGSGVSKFKVTSDRGFTASDLKALSSPTYSSQFIFDRETASFKMTSSSQPNPQPKPVPEPTSALALLIFGGAWMLKRQYSCSTKVQLVSKSDAVG
ncbi:PEP-CTERM sorting domain-containing protein [Aerosakkonemataceae cyanobacterium BLCC-F50]|uniref:PEP-CTERM sorting domain-containing protein n=1 Tax=Floridaenema flaviceps BLCC-F50 TaxID=3153642 RepID=A0ABV4XJT8_9CYAN